MKLILVCYACALLVIASIESDKFYLSKVDNLVYEKLTDPVFGEGEYVIDSLLIFNKELNHTIQVYKHNRTGQDIVDMLIKNGGPKCMRVYPNDTVLEIVYEWGVKELGELYHFLCETKALWRDFRFYLTTDLHYEIDPLPFFVTTTVKSNT